MLTIKRWKPRRRLRVWSIALVLAAAWPGVTAAQLTPTLGIQVDQDVFFAPAEDKDYTMGVQFDLPRIRLGNRLRKVLHFPERWVSDSVIASNVSAGFSAFTPLKGTDGRILADKRPLFDDRPYASLLFAKASWGTWNENNAVFTELTVGLLGTRIGESFQTWVHQNISGDVDPGGWPNQICDRGGLECLTGAFRIAYKRRLLGNPAIVYDEDAFPGDVSVSVDAVGGFYTMGRVGVTARLGWVKSPWATAGTIMTGPSPMKSAMAAGMDSGQVDTISKARGLVTARASAPTSCFCAFIPKELYLSLNVGMQRWVRNTLLQGKGRSAVVLSFNPESIAPMRRSVKDVSVSVNARWERFGASWGVITWHSPLFDGPNSRNHEWGTIRLDFFRM